MMVINLTALITLTQQRPMKLYYLMTGEEGGEVVVVSTNVGRHVYLHREEFRMVLLLCQQHLHIRTMIRITAQMDIVQVPNSAEARRLELTQEDALS